jgi:hypothetical protein
LIKLADEARSEALAARASPLLRKLTRAEVGMELELYWRSGCDD